MEQTECSETSVYKIQTPGNYPEESIKHAEHDESLKSRRKGIISGDIFGDGKVIYNTVVVPCILV